VHSYRKRLAAGKPVSYRDLIVPVSAAHMPLPIYKQIASDDYERPELDAAQGLIRDGDKVLELGTGLGIVSSLISRMAKNVEIRSFEANPALLPHIENLHRLTGITNIDVRNETLEPNPTEKTRTFHVHRYFAEGSIYQTDHSQSEIDVPVLDINTQIHDFQPTVLICDIEGAEDIVIPGCDLSAIRALVLELHPKVVSRQGIKDIFDACMAAQLYPRVELSSETVIAFERIDDLG
jgi:FkbM family methyltransferase